MDRPGYSGEDDERNREQKSIAVELMTSGMAKERKDENDRDESTDEAGNYDER